MANKDYSVVFLGSLALRFDSVNRFHNARDLVDLWMNVEDFKRSCTVSVTPLNTQISSVCLTIKRELGDVTGPLVVTTNLSALTGLYPMIIPFSSFQF